MSYKTILRLLNPEQILKGREGGREGEREREREREKRERGREREREMRREREREREERERELKVNKGCVYSLCFKIVPLTFILLTAGKMLLKLLLMTELMKNVWLHEGDKTRTRNTEYTKILFMCVCRETNLILDRIVATTVTSHQ